MQWETRAKRLYIFASLPDGSKGYTGEGVKSPALPRRDDVITEICGAETLLKCMALLTSAWIFNLFFAHIPLKTLLSHTALRLDYISGENLLNNLLNNSFCLEDNGKINFKKSIIFRFSFLPESVLILQKAFFNM